VLKKEEKRKREREKKEEKSEAKTAVRDCGERGGLCLWRLELKCLSLHTEVQVPGYRMWTAHPL